MKHEPISNRKSIGFGLQRKEKMKTLQLYFLFDEESILNLNFKFRDRSN